MARQGGRVVDDDSDDDVPVASSSRGPAMPSSTAEKLEELASEIQQVDDDISELRTLRQSLEKQRRQLLAKAQAQSGYNSNGNSVATAGPSRLAAGTDYTQSTFPWSGELLNRAKATWGIEKWRMCQEGVVNAVLDGQDVVCIMPTGGGKSLCYQLPAIMSPGVTLVISPLISLSTDQCFHLRDAGVPCEFMSSALDRPEANSILRRIKNSGRQQPGDEEIQILFVTPERVVKSKTLLSSLQTAYQRHRLARVVIDEAHCCSNQGHDFRPDYRKLSMLRKLFPETRATCLTATCSPSVLQDVLEILGMPDTTEPTNARPNKTVFFTAPLHRPNLNYKVVPRPSTSAAANQAIADWILEHHPNETGIVYCLSKKDTETMADALSELSEGKIRAGVYHADVDDREKHRIHVRWREGRIRVVCATIAFGMGIDKPDVRFVLHSGVSKSLEGYYQESGRAGRDGNPSDCVLFYRPQDASRMASLVAGEPTGREKLGAMLDYAQSSRCRKVIFGEYFSDAYQDEETCGRCDNCLERPEPRDCSFYAWQIVNAMREMYDDGGRVTLGNLADLVRGLKGGQYTVIADSRGGKKKRKGASSGGQTALLQMDQHGGKITELSSDDVERVIVALLNKQYLDDEYHATAYSVNVYVKPGPQAIRLTRLSEENARQLTGLLDVNLSSKPKKKAKARKSNAEEENGEGTVAGSKKKGNGSSGPPKKRQQGKERTLTDDLDDIIDSDEEAAFTESASAAAESSSKPATGLTATAGRSFSGTQRPISELLERMSASRSKSGERGQEYKKKRIRPSSSDEEDDDIKVDRNGWQVMPSRLAGKSALPTSSGSRSSGVKDEPIEID